MTTTGIVCPICKDGRPGVLASQPLDKARRRRYRCDAGHRFSTLEVIIEAGKPVVLEMGASGVTRMSLDDWLGRRVERAASAVRDAFR